MGAYSLLSCSPIFGSPLRLASRSRLSGEDDPEQATLQYDSVCAVARTSRERNCLCGKFCHALSLTGIISSSRRAQATVRQALPSQLQCTMSFDLQPAGFLHPNQVLTVGQAAAWIRSLIDHFTASTCIERRVPVEGCRYSSRCISRRCRHAAYLPIGTTRRKIRGGAEETARACRRAGAAAVSDLLLPA